MRRFQDPVLVNVRLSSVKRCAIMAERWLWERLCYWTLAVHEVEKVGVGGGDGISGNPDIQELCDALIPCGA